MADSDPDLGAAPTAPELPHKVAKEYGLHKEPLHAPAKKVGGIGDGSDDAADEATGTESGQANERQANATGVLQDSSVEEDPETDAAVDSIIAEESDELLDMQDEGRLPVVKVKQGRGLGHFFASWWRKKWLRWLTILIVLGAIGGVMATPRTRYYALNLCGVRSSMTIVVVDNTTSLPLKNVTIQLGAMQAQTDVQGTARLAGLRLGDYDLRISRTGFSSSDQHLTIGWGSNPLGTYKLVAVGTQYAFRVVDYLSNKPIANVDAESDSVNALSDAQGKITLTVQDSTATTLTVTLNAAGYRSEPITLNAQSKNMPTIMLVSSQKEVFMSTDNGGHDVYSIDLDGKNKKLLLAGTGNEGTNNTLVTNADGSKAALVSIRDTNRETDGSLDQTLTLINVPDGTSTTIDRAEKINLIDWTTSALVYRTTALGSSPPATETSRLISYNPSTNNKAQLATAQQFTTVASAQGVIYYAIANEDSHTTFDFFSIHADGSGSQGLFDQEVLKSIRSTYNTMNLQTPDGWYTYTFGDPRPSRSTDPSDLTNYSFASDPTGQLSAWISPGSAAATLQIRHADGTNATLISRAGISYPVRWAGANAIIYRVSAGGETADYVIGTDTGDTSHKLTDVQATTGYFQGS